MLRERIEFRAEQDAGFFAGVPAAAAVFALRGEDPTAEPYVSKTANLRRRLQRLLGSPEERTRKLNLRDRVRWVEYSLTGSDFESGFLLYRLLRETFPKTYEKRLRFRWAPLIKFHLENEYPRASITARLGKIGGRSAYYGPFPTRAVAEKFLNDSLDFFKMRRCVEDLKPDPKFPGCIYSEMKMCLAPCFKGCTDEEYRVEVRRVQAFLDSGGASLEREFIAERDAASTALEFENAAAAHTHIDKLKPVLGQLPAMVRRLDRLSGIVVQRSCDTNCVSLFRLDAGCLAGPFLFLIQPPEHTKSQSMESRIEAVLAEAQPAAVSSALERMEHIAILKRWYYRSSRVGEIFLIDDKGQLPMRRVVRGIGRVWKGEAPEASFGV